MADIAHLGNSDTQLPKNQVIRVRSKAATHYLIPRAILFLLILGIEEGRDRIINEKHLSTIPCTSATGDKACKPGTCLDGEFNWQPPYAWVHAQPVEPPQPMPRAIL